VNTALLDPYVSGSSVIHRCDARLKLAVTLAYILAVNLTPVQIWPALLAYLLAMVAAVALAGLPPRSVLVRSAVALPFVLLAVFGAPFVREGVPLVSAEILGRLVQLTDVGLWRLAAVLARSWLSLLAAATLILTTPFTALLKAMRGLGVPLILTAIIALMYRYLYVLVEEASRMMRARDARSGDDGGGHSGGSLRWRARVAGHMIGTLFLRTYERSERIYQAMLARGYTGEIRVLAESRLSRAQLAVGAALILLLALISLAANLYR
jgi:cobalt/nickel transport system permease protein